MKLRIITILVHGIIGTEGARRAFTFLALAYLMASGPASRTLSDVKRIKQNFFGSVIVLGGQ